MRLFTVLLVSGAVSLSACDRSFLVQPDRHAATSASLERSAHAAGAPWSTPVNLGGAVNSAFDDMHPAISPDGLSLYFSSNRPDGSGSYDLWVSHRRSTDADWGAPVNLGQVLNSPAAETAPAFDASGHILFFGSERAGGCGGRDLWMSFRKNKKNDFAWETPVNLGCSVNSTGFDDGPAYFEDEETGTATLYFISNRPGGLGDRDAWATTINADGSFTTPVNISELNSTAADSRPAVTRDGLEFFLTSQRVGSALSASGAPSSDIWWSVRETTDAPWSPPVNLAEVNTAFGEAAPSISKDRRTMYFNSNRPGGFGGQDLLVSKREKVVGR